MPAGMHLDLSFSVLFKEIDFIFSLACTLFCFNLNLSWGQVNEEFLVLKLSMIEWGEYMISL